MLPFSFRVASFPQLLLCHSPLPLQQNDNSDQSNLCCYIWFRVSLVMQAYNSWRSKFQRPTLNPKPLPHTCPKMATGQFFFKFFPRNPDQINSSRSKYQSNIVPNPTSCYLGRCLLKKGDICLVLQVTKPLSPSHTHPTHKFSEPGFRRFSKCTKFMLLKNPSTHHGYNLRPLRLWKLVPPT
jgi:hypothetical protein